jgi:hypothetical protein
MNLQEGDVAVDWPSPAARAMRLTTRGSLPAARAMRLTTRGLRHAPHGKGDFYLSHKKVR